MKVKVYPKFICQIKHGKILMEGMVKDTYEGYLATLPEGFYDITVKHHTDEAPTRSSQENRYFHGVICSILAEHLGYTEHEIKDILKAKFLSTPTLVNNTGFLHIKPTHSLTTSEFEKFCQDIREWSSAELGCYLPKPNEVSIDDMEE